MTKEKASQAYKRKWTQETRTGGQRTAMQKERQQTELQQAPSLQPSVQEVEGRASGSEWGRSASLSLVQCKAAGRVVLEPPEEHGYWFWGCSLPGPRVQGPGSTEVPQQGPGKPRTVPGC
jgi:hypothetical protein